MTKAKTRIERPVVVENLFAPWFTQAALVFTLAVMIGRALIMESLRDAFTIGAGGPVGPGAATTMVLDALCCVPALLVLTRRVIERDYVIRWTWSMVLLTAFAAWAALSVTWSGDRFAAIVAAANLIAAAALVWSTAQLVRSWLRLRIVAGICLGLLLAYWAHGLIYKFIDAAHHQQFWDENKAEILRKRGWEPDSAIAKQFEHKFVGGELIGFNESPNSFAAVIVLLMVISAGVAIQRRASGDPIGWSIGIALACAPALLVIYYTGTRTAVGTLFIAAATFLLLASSRARQWLTTHSKSAYWAGLAAFFLGAAALVGHGVHHGTLPHESLNFRWRYWIAAAELVKRHPLAGVGWANFGSSYLAVRVPAAAEEVRDPHNFIVRAFAELGIVGGVLVILWLARAAWELTRPVAPPPPNALAKPSLHSGLALILTIITAGIVLATVVAIDFSQNPDYILLEVFRRVLFLGLLCVGAVLATTRTRPVQDLDDRPSPWVLAAFVIGLAVFFIHNLMDFVLGEAGGMTIFAVILGAASGARMPSVAGARRRHGVAIGALAAAGIAWVVGVLMLVIPIVSAEQQADAGDAAVETDPRRARISFFNAYRLYPANADYAYRTAIAAIQSGDTPDQVKSYLGIAIATNPRNVMYYLTRARYELRLPAPDIPPVRADFEKAIALDPQNIETRLEFAELLSKWNDRPAAVEQYRAALETNRQYDPKEPERLSPARVREIEERVKSLAS